MMLHTQTEITTHYIADEPFSDTCDKWLQIHANILKPASTSKYIFILEKYIKPCLGTYTVPEIGTERIGFFSHHLQHEKKLSIKTIRDVLVLLHTVLADARQAMDCPLPAMKIIYPKEPPKELRVLTRAEQQTLTQYLNQDMDIYKFSVLLALATGLRIGEICGLRWTDISTTTGTLRVRNTIQRVKNLKNPSETKTIIQLGPPKTYSSIRTIPLTESIRLLCLRFQIDDPEAFVLTGCKKMPEPRILQRKMKSFTDACHLENVHFHTLRHTFATRCIEVGCDVKTLSEILGHSSIHMTMNRYVHPSIELKRQNLQKLDQAGFASDFKE